jgi:hypothetical protein
LHAWLRTGSGSWLGGAKIRANVGNMLAWANVT